jgi:hypothetical protein
MKVRVRPFDVRDLARHLHGLVAIEDSGERVMRSRESCREHSTTEHEQQSESTHGGAPLTIVPLSAGRPYRLKEYAR